MNIKAMLTVLLVKLKKSSKKSSFYLKMFAYTENNVYIRLNTLCSDRMRGESSEIKINKERVHGG